MSNIMPRTDRHLAVREHLANRALDSKRNATGVPIDQATAGHKMAARLYRLSRAPVPHSSWPYREWGKVGSGEGRSPLGHNMAAFAFL